MKADQELEQKVKKVGERLCENVHIVGNEPSLAMYRIQEHVRKTTPLLVTKRIEANELQKHLQGKCYDLEYAINAARSMHKSSGHFHAISESLKNAMFLRQQLAYEETKRTQQRRHSLGTGNTAQGNSSTMYQRLSSIDFNDLPEALRPVANVIAASAADYIQGNHARAKEAKEQAQRSSSQSSLDKRKSEEGEPLP